MKTIIDEKDLLVEQDSAIYETKCTYVLLD